MVGVKRLISASGLILSQASLASIPALSSPINDGLQSVRWRGGVRMAPGEITRTYQSGSQGCFHFYIMSAWPLCRHHVNSDMGDVPHRAAENRRRIIDAMW